MFNASYFYINPANTDESATVSIPASAIERLLIAPSISPISIALAVPIAWAADPNASPLAIGSFILNILHKILWLLGIIVISFAIFIGISWLLDDLNWYEYQSDYYKEGTVIDKTTIGHQVGYEMYLTVEFDDGTVCSYRPQGRSDYPNDNLLSLGVTRIWDLKKRQRINKWSSHSKSLFHSDFEEVRKCHSLDLMKILQIIGSQVR